MADIKVTDPHDGQSHDAYVRGEMDVDGHEETFGGFMTLSVYGGAAIIVSLLLPILVFGVNLGFFTSLIITLVLGVIIGVIMKFHGRWYAILVAMAVAIVVIYGIVSLIT